MNDELQLGKFEFYPNEDKVESRDLFDLEIEDLGEKTIDELLNDLET